MTFPDILNQAQFYYLKYQSKLYPIAAVIFFVLGTVFILLGIFLSKSQPVQGKASETLSKVQDTVKEILPQETKPTKIQVDIAGAVSKPGVYELDAQARLLAGIEAAGGFDSKVNKSYVAKSLNLSQQLTDQQKIYIPFNGENVEALAAVQPPSSSKTSTNSTDPTSNIINLNSASQAEIETLVGVGEVRAQNVISGRPFKSLQELVQKGILTQKILTDNKDKIKI